MDFEARPQISRSTSSHPQRQPIATEGTTQVRPRYAEPPRQTPDSSMRGTAAQVCPRPTLCDLEGLHEVDVLPDFGCSSYTSLRAKESNSAAVPPSPRFMPSWQS